MQVHDGPQIDLSAQVAMVRAKARPWKSIFALTLAIVAASVSGWAHGHFVHFFDKHDFVNQVIAAATAIAFCVFASGATIGLSAKARDVLRPMVGASHASVVRYALVLIGMVTTLLVTLALFGVPVGQLLLGGALTSVFVGIAAQQALSNVFAGMVLLLTSPFKVGDAVLLRAGALGGSIEGTVSEIGITYLRITTPDGPVSVPNSQVLNAVVAPPSTRFTDPPGTVNAPSVPALPATVQPEAAPAEGSPAGPVGTIAGAGGAQRPGSSGEQ